MKNFLLLFLLLFALNVQADYLNKTIVDSVFDSTNNVINSDASLNKYKDTIIQQSLVEIQDILEQQQKGIAGEIGRAIIGAIAEEVVHRVVDRVVDHYNKPSPTPERRETNPPREAQPPRNDGDGPEPKPCPVPGQ